MNSYLPITTRTHLSRAFSLVELVLVVSIVAILASISIVSFSNVFSGAQLDNAAKRLVADLKLTKQQAIQNRTTYAFEINPTGQYYQATGVKDLAGNSSIHFDMNQHSNQAINIELNLKNNSDNVIHFDARGRASNPGNIILSNDDRQKIITVSTEGQIDETQ